MFGVVSILCAQQGAKPVVSVEARSSGVLPVSHSAFIMSAMCDEEGNVYSRPFDPETAWGAIQEMTGQAKPAGRFPAKGKTFFVRDGRVYAVAGSNPGGIAVVEFAQDGSVKAQTKLGVDFFIDVLHLAVFKSGEYLVVGLTGSLTGTTPHLRTPFTAVFAADGRLVKKIYEPEDEDASQRAEGSDSKYLLCCSDSGNEFVMYKADAASGSDGDVYLLHGTSPPLIYVISPAGDVVRKLRIDAGNPELTANSIKFYNGRLAIGFNWLGDVPKSLIKVIDLKGNSIADYEVKEGTGDSDPILACYNSEGFTLIPRWAGTNPYLLKAKLP
jgi:hypothetical protein